MTIKTFTQFTEEKEPKLLKMKGGNVQLKTPIEFTYDKIWKEYTFKSPENNKTLSGISSNQVTVKNGKIIGCIPEITKKLELETIGDKQGETNQEKRDRLEKEEREEARKKIDTAWEKSGMKYQIRAMRIQDDYKLGKISKEEANRRIDLLNDEIKNNK